MQAVNSCAFFKFSEHLFSWLYSCQFFSDDFKKALSHGCLKKFKTQEPAMPTPFRTPSGKLRFPFRILPDSKGFQRSAKTSPRWSAAKRACPAHNYMSTPSNPNAWIQGPAYNSKKPPKPKKLYASQSKSMVRGPGPPPQETSQPPRTGTPLNPNQ